MVYVPDPTDATRPTDLDPADSMALEFRSLKGYLNAVDAINLDVDAADTARILAQQAQVEAQASAASAANAFDSFDDIYLGTKVSAPTTANGGNALADGMLYFDSTINKLGAYDLGNATWIYVLPTSIAAMADVALSAPVSGELLVWNGSDWANKTRAEAGIQVASADISTVAATTAEMEAGTVTANRTMNPAGVKDAIVAHVPSSGMAKAWINFNGTGVVAIRSSYNVSSITDNGTGSYTINLTNNMADTNYSISGSCGIGPSSATKILSSSILTAGSFDVGTSNTTGALEDMLNSYAQVFGN